MNCYEEKLTREGKVALVLVALMFLLAVTLFVGDLWNDNMACPETKTYWVDPEGYWNRCTFKIPCKIEFAFKCAEVGDFINFHHGTYNSSRSFEKIH